MEALGGALGGALRRALGGALMGTLATHLQVLLREHLWDHDTSLRDGRPYVYRSGDDCFSARRLPHINTCTCLHDVDKNRNDRQFSNFYVMVEHDK